MPKANLLGVRFGRLFVQAGAPNVVLSSGRSLAAWLCHCDCGTLKTITAQDLRSAKSRSCGCFRVEVGRTKTLTHGQSRKGRWAPEYRSWAGMLQRCTNPNNTDYQDYGRRGIRVCERWHNSFEAVFADMGRKPAAHYSIDRIDVDGHYEPGNCRWATPSQQVANRRSKERVAKDRAAALATFHAVELIPSSPPRSDTNAERGQRLYGYDTPNTPTCAGSGARPAPGRRDRRDGHDRAGEAQV